MWDKRNVTKQAQGAMMQDPLQGEIHGRKDLFGISRVGWDAEQLQKEIKGRMTGRGGEEYSPKQVKFLLAVADFGIDFAALRDISNKRIRELGTLQDASGVGSQGGNWAIVVLNAMRLNLSRQDERESIEISARRIAARMQNLPPPINDSTLQQAGQQSTVTVINQSTVQNVSTASSSSKENNVGQYGKQSIPISNRDPAPRSV